MIRRDDVYKIGKLGKPHGVKGEITFAITDDVFDRVDADYLILDIDGILVPFYIEEYRFKNDENVLVKFEDIDTQEQVRAYTGCDVCSSDLRCSFPVISPTAMRRICRGQKLSASSLLMPLPVW